MKKSHIVSFSIASLLGLNMACGALNSSNLDASVGQSITQKWGSKFDLSKELSPTLGDNLSATKARLDSVEIGIKASPTLKFGSITILRIGPTVELKSVFDRKVFNQVVIGREKDADGSGDGEGLFLDKNTVAANRFVNCKSQKVITDGTQKLITGSGGISFLGLNLGREKNTNTTMTTTTDYTMNRGYYKTKEAISINDLLQACADIAATDEGLKNISSIAEVVQMNFDQGDKLESLANDVAAGKKVNNFQFHNIKYDFKIRARENGKIFFEVFPDTYYADPKLDVEVRYTMEGSIARIDEVIPSCKSNCQNYIDQNGKHGLHGYGENATKAQSDEYLKIISSIFAARALNSK